MITLAQNTSEAEKPPRLDTINNDRTSGVNRNDSLPFTSEVKGATTVKTGQLTLLQLAPTEFSWHPVVLENFLNSKYLEKILNLLCERKPKNYEKLLATEDVGPKTMRALSLVAEVIYGAKPSYEDPARYSFAHGGKDATPYPVDRKTYDETIEFFQKIINKTKLSFFEKKKIMERLRF